MKKIWLTDIHLNFLSLEERRQFYNKLIASNAEAVFITGDIAEAPSVAYLLKEMADSIQKPIYFVLGNHDYYRAHVEAVRKEMTLLSEQAPLLYWLPATGPQVLEQDVIVIGQDGWADGRCGNYQHSPLTLKDCRMIADLIESKAISKQALLEKMQQLADIDAHHLNRHLQQAIASHQTKKIIILTHIPPFKEACRYEGKLTDNDWLPYFSSKATGEVLLHMAKQNAAIEFLTLCGHTHNEAYYQPLDNLIIKVGKAEYYKPEIQLLV